MGVLFWAREKEFYFSIASRLPLWPTQPPVNLVLGLFSLFLISPPPGARVKYAWNHTSCPHKFSCCGAK